MRCTSHPEDSPGVRDKRLQLQAGAQEGRLWGLGVGLGSTGDFLSKVT